MDNRLNKPLVIAMVAVALVLGVVVGITTGVADWIFGGPNPKTIASASLVAEWLEAAPVDEAKQLTAERVAQQLDLAPERLDVARMAVDAGLQAIASAFAR